MLYDYNELSTDVGLRLPAQRVVQSAVPTSRPKPSGAKQARSVRRTTGSAKPSQGRAGHQRVAWRIESRGTRQGGSRGGPHERKSIIAERFAAAAMPSFRGRSWAALYRRPRSSDDQKVIFTPP